MTNPLPPSPPASPYAGLALLLKAPNKASVLRAFNHVFIHRMDTAPADRALPLFINDFGLSPVEAIQLFEALLAAIKTALYTGEWFEVERSIQEDQVEVDARILPLIRQIVEVQLPEWKEASTNQRPSLPKLVDVNWRIDIKAASQQMRKLPPVPSVLVELEVQGQQMRRGEMPPQEKVTLELSKEALGTMLEGMRKIRDQLSSTVSSAS